MLSYMATYYLLTSPIIGPSIYFHYRPFHLFPSKTLMNSLTLFSFEWLTLTMDWRLYKSIYKWLPHAYMHRCLKLISILNHTTHFCKYWPLQTIYQSIDLEGLYMCYLESIIKERAVTNTPVLATYSNTWTLQY